MTEEPDIDRDGVWLHLVPVTDPQTRQCLPAREPAIRLRRLLKEALRAHGFRCVRIMGLRDLPATSGEDHDE